MISIITPVYNGERFIESCIKLVIDQNCPDAEHIIIDGGSTDRTVEIIKQYAKQYPHIRWISEKDRGQSDAMNKGIAMAKGEIIGFLNVDDYYEPNVLNQIVEIFKTLPKPSLVVGNCNVWGNKGELMWVNKPKNLSFLKLLSDTTPFPENPSAYFYHKFLHQRIGQYKVDEHYIMDIDFILKAVQVSSVKYFDEIWGNFRLINGTKTSTDKESDSAGYRFQELLGIYRKRLSPIQQLQMNLILAKRWPSVIKNKLANLGKKLYFKLRPMS